MKLLWMEKVTVPAGGNGGPMCFLLPHHTRSLLLGSGLIGCLGSLAADFLSGGGLKIRKVKNVLQKSRFKEDK